MHLAAPLRVTTLALAAITLSALAQAQGEPHTLKFGAVRYTTHSKTNGVTGVGIPAGADAQTGDATTLVFTYEYALGSNLGVEAVLGVPPKISAQASGTVAFLGEVMSASVVSPTLFVNYHFGTPGSTWRPYLGLGLNYTKFANIESPYGWDVKMSDSVGLAASAGIDYRIDARWGLWASVAAIKVKSDLVAVSGTVLQSTIDFRPITYAIGASMRF
jgi:outer membrane protein